MGEDGTNTMNEPGCSAEIQDHKHVLKELSLECLSFSDFFSGPLSASIGQSVAHSLNDMPDLDADSLMIGPAPTREATVHYRPCTSGLTPRCNFPGKLTISFAIRCCPWPSTGIAASLSFHMYFFPLRFFKVLFPDLKS